MMKKIWNYTIKSKLLNAVLLVVLPILTLMCLEFYTHVPWDLSVPIFFLNLGFYYLLFALFSFALGSTRTGYAAAPFFPMIFGMINYFVVDFRSSPIVPWDLYSIRTAASVAGNYEFTITPRLIWVVLGFLAIAFLGSKTGISLKKPRLRIACLILTAAGMFGYVKGVGTDAAVELFGLDTTLFTPNVLYRNNGLTAGFLGNLKYMKVEKPQGYSPERAREIAADQALQDTAKTSELEDMPNVIVIMNEAFSDLSVFGEFATDSDYMPFIRSLEENTVKGTCYVSVKGGNTANSEYEFLTGDSMAFLPAGSVPYQQFIKGEMPSLASHFNSLGYRTAALHPYNASGWARDKVYPWLGFEETYFKADFEDPVKLRSYISDVSAFQKLIQLYEEKEEGERLFAFEVTMQNHGGYSKDVPDFSEAIHLTELKDKTTSVRAAEKYLTLIRESDRAFEMLVNYFKDQEEDTVILMFGDHQPSDYITNTILRLVGRERDGAEEDGVFFDNHAVPFVLWANYDIPEERVEAVSVNYLGGILMEKAGLSLTPYQNFLEELRLEFPVITANMIMDDKGEHSRFDEAGQEIKDRLEDYRILSYNHLADSKHRLPEFFD